MNFFIIIILSLLCSLTFIRVLLFSINVGLPLSATICEDPKSTDTMKKYFGILQKRYFCAITLSFLLFIVYTIIVNKIIKGYLGWYFLFTFIFSVIVSAFNKPTEKNTDKVWKRAWKLEARVHIKSERERRERILDFKNVKSIDFSEEDEEDITDDLEKEK